MCKVAGRRREGVGKEKDDKNSEKLSQTLIKDLTQHWNICCCLCHPATPALRLFFFRSKAKQMLRGGGDFTR